MNDTDQTTGTSDASSNAILRRAILVIAIVAAIALGWLVGVWLGNKEEDTETGAASVHDDEYGEIYPDVGAVVVRLDPEEASFTVDHEEIEGFMRAMVMDLKVADPEELEGLEPDDEILFDMAQVDGVFKAVNIRRKTGDSDGSGSNPGEADAPPNTAGEPPLNPGDLVPDLTLYDGTGERFELRELESRHTIITFFYARCPLDDFCPAQARRLSELQEQLEENERDVHLLTLTLDSEHDGPELLAGYAERFNANPAHWTFAGSDDAEAIRRFADRAGANIHEHPESYEIDHALIALRVDGDRIVDRVYGLEAIERLIRNM